MVGDLYQPFHCIDKKEGGNKLLVKFYGNPLKLHYVWDTGIIFRKDPSHQKARTLSIEIEAEHGDTYRSANNFVEAAEKSHERAVKNSYGFRQGQKLGTEYVNTAWPTIKACLWEAACMAATIGPDLL